MKRRSSPSLAAGTSAMQLLSEQLVQARRIGLALGRFHRLSDEESAQLILAGTILSELPRIGRHDGIDCRFDGRLISDLAPATRFDDRIGVLAVLPHGLEHVFGNLAR